MKTLVPLYLLLGALAVVSCNGDNVDLCPTGCAIDGTCYPDGVADPDNACQRCDAAASKTGWTASTGTTCDDGSFCTTNDTCNAGTCVGGPARECSDSVACNGTETCDEATDKCVAGTSTCGVGSLCDFSSDTCTPTVTCPGCTINGTCFGDGQRDPLNPCLICDIDQSTTAFVNNDGAACDDDMFCTTDDTCSAGVCAGSAR
ncbi:MAG: hypothetical protein AB7O24_24295, partial [Kofleriaceae bacterium]